jgi:hypothetical protein
VPLNTSEVEFFGGHQKLGEPWYVASLHNRFWSMDVIPLFFVVVRVDVIFPVENN